MINIVFLDTVWKCLLTLTYSSSIVFTISLLGQALIKIFISNEKAKQLLNYHSLFIFITATIGFLILNFEDPELLAECFNRFVINSSSYTITRLFAALYLSILSVVLVLDFFKLYIEIKKHCSFNKIENHLINDVLENLKRHLLIKNSIEILLNKKATSPYVWGLVKHRIVVNPNLLSSKDKGHITTILSHELMHIIGRDSAWLLLSHLLKRIFFFNPISYIFYKKHKLMVEMAADESAVRKCGIKPKNLLKSIIKIAEASTKFQDNLLQMNASQGFEEIKERVQSMMSERKKKVVWAYPIISITSLILSLIITAVQTSASVGTLPSRLDSVEFMCSQVRHEKAIGNLLRIESQQNKCEMNK